MGLDRGRKSFISVIETKVKTLPRVRRDPPWNGANYIGRGMSRFEFLDIPYPELRKFFSVHMPEAEPEDWDAVFWRGRYFEAALWALAALRKMSSAHQATLLQSWAKGVDNWALSDDLSSVLVKHVEQNLPLWKPVLRAWSRSKEPWERRQSLVALFYYASQREKAPPWPLVKEICLRLWLDEDFYVQKGLGWCLRESQVFYRDEAIALLEARAETLSPAAWQAATEKLPMGLRRRWKARRKRTSN
jgi:3-methyladenine DNA glycosylase AlkD